MWGWQEAAMRRTASVILGTTALITSAIAVPAQAALSAPAGSVIYGTVLAAGHPVAGAEVTLYAWPDQKVTAAMKVGQQVPLVAVGQAVSSSTGSYGVAVSDYAALRARADHGIVNLVATAVSGRTAGTFSFSRRLVAGGTELAADTNAAVPSTAPQTASLNLADGPSAPGVQCGMWHLLRTYPPTNVVVGATFSRVSYERTNFFYGVGQNSSIGVGVGNGKPSRSAAARRSARKSGSTCPRAPATARQRICITTRSTPITCAGRTTTWAVRPSGLWPGCRLDAAEVGRGGRGSAPGAPGRLLLLRPVGQRRARE
jgi:hypothetical protein